MVWQVTRFVELSRELGVGGALRQTLVYLGVWNALRFRDARLMFACDVERPLPPSTRLIHPVGIVVNTSSEIGERVQINQNVTIGMNSEGAPTIHDDVTIFSGAVVLGDVTVGEGAVVGANAVVLDDVAPGATVVGAPATEVGRED